MYLNKITKITVLLWSFASTCGFVSAQTYQVKGGNVLKIMQSGEQARSDNFQVNAYLKPMATIITRFDVGTGGGDIGGGNMGGTTGETDTGTTTTIVQNKPIKEGGQRHSNDWILKKKYNELVLKRDERLKASAPKKRLSFLPTDPDKVEKVSELFKQKPKPPIRNLEKVPVQVVTKKGSKDYYRSTQTQNLINKSGEPLRIYTEYSDLFSSDNLHGSAKKQKFELYEKDETDCTKESDSGSYFENNLFIFIYGVLILFFIILCLIVLLAWVFYLKHKEYMFVDRKSYNTNKFSDINRKEDVTLEVKVKPSKKFRSLLFLFFLLIPLCSFSESAFAETTTPQKIIYEGELLNSSGQALTGNYDFRFSLWDNQDFDINDRLSEGELNSEASDFFGWQEVQSYNITNNGRFSFQIGTVTPFTANLFDKTDISLQIEVKQNGQSDQSYELIDLDYTNDTIDRMVIDTVPFAFNADKLDFREAGYNIGDIPYLDELGKLPSFILPDIDAISLGSKILGFGADNIPYLDATGKLTSDILPDEILNNDNALTLVGRSPGYTADDIPYLDANGKLPESIIPDSIAAGDATTLGGKSLGFMADNIPYLDVFARLPQSALPVNIHAITADEADHADSADHATTSDTATHSITANHATTADSATHANDADTLDGHGIGISSYDIPLLDISGKLPTILLPDNIHATTADDATLVDGRSVGYAADEIPYLDFAGKLPSIVLPDNIHAATADNATQANHAMTANNSDTIDGRDTGYSVGDIPFINASGFLPASILPGGGLGSTGTDSNIFRLDEDGSAGPFDRIYLQFGLTVNETLAWNIEDDQFELSDDLLVNGDIQTMGTINGITIGVKDKNHVLSPRYPNSIFQGDGTDNSKGYMYEEEETVLGNMKNILRWRSRDTDIQDYDIIIRYALDDKFNGFQTPALSLEYLTEGLLIDSRIDIKVEKEGLLGDQLVGSGTGLSSNAWNKRTFELTGGATWNKGDVMIIRIKMHSRTDNSSKIADITVNTRTE